MTNLEQLKAARFIAATFNHIAYSAPLPEKDKELSWAHVLCMAKNHSVLGIVFSVFEEVLKKELPEDVFALCQREVSIANAKHIAQVAEFSEISRKFTKAGVYFMPLKGYHIKNLYPSPELRTMNDIDVLVFPAYVDAAKSILLDSGYEFCGGGMVHDVYKKLPFLEVEVHKILSSAWKNYRFEESLPNGENEHFRLMNPEDFFIFLLYHSVKHHNAGGCGLRTVFDISLVKKHILKDADIGALENRIKELGLWDFYSKVCALEKFWFFGDPANDELLEFELYTVSGGTYGTKVNYVSKEIKNGEVRFFFLRLFPPYSFMKKAFPVLEKAPFLLPIFHVWRLTKSIFTGSYEKDFLTLKEHKKLVKKAKNEEKSK
jgi:hypothetical protein